MRNLLVALLLAANLAAQGNGPAEKPIEDWRAEEKAPIAGRAVVARDRVLYLAGSRLVCRTRETGDLIWQATVRDRVSPTVFEDLVWVGLAAYQLQTGKPDRDLSKEGVASTPAVFSGKGHGAVGLVGGGALLIPREGEPFKVEGQAVYPALGIANFLCLSDSVGLFQMVQVPKQEVYWKRDLKAAPLGGPVRAKGGIFLPVKGAVLVRAMKDGREVERIAAREISTPLSVHQELIAYGTSEGVVVRLDGERRQELGRISVTAEPITMVLVTPRFVYGISGKTLFAVHAKTGERVWGLRAEIAFTEPCSADGAIYVGTGKVFSCLR